MEKIHESFERFWQQCPALLYGMAMCLGSAYALGATVQASIVSAALILPLCARPPCASKQLLARLCCALLLCAATAAYVHTTYSFPPLPTTGIKGQGVVSISSVSNQAHPFGNRWQFRGTLRHFTPDGRNTPSEEIKNIPLTISLPDTDALQRPPATSDFLIKGILKNTQNGKYILHTSKQDPWHPLANTWSTAEIRYYLKQAFANNIKKHYLNPPSQSFLIGIATGDFDDRAMAQDFSRFGLQHIMAISGFHFSIIAAFFSIILGAFLPKRKALLLLAFLLTSYFLFLGTSASIMRAWIMCLTASLGIIFEKQPYGLNSLGIALMCVILYDPLQILNLGFQFSFATTAAILLLYSPIDNAIQLLFKKRSLHEALRMPDTDKHAYILLSIIRQGLSLTIAVNLIALPITLFYFQKFPWMSLLFNLFFPFLVSIAIILLIAATGITLIIPQLGSTIHYLNDNYTQLMLNFTTYTPKAFDLYLRTSELPPWLPITILTLIFTIGIYTKYSSQQQHNDWAFI